MADIAARPVVRAGNQRNRPQPDPFVFPPQTPPDSATLDWKLRPTSNEWEQSLYGSRTPRSEPTPPLPPNLVKEYEARQQVDAEHISNSRPSAHARSHSFSTIDDRTTTSGTVEPGTFKVVIERPPFGGRPKTADTSSLPLLQVPIPHYRLGTPRFSTRGTVDLRSSTYTRTSATEEFRNSLLTPQRVGSHSFLSSRPQSDAFSPVPAKYRATMDRPPLPASAPSSSRVSHSPIGPRLYDALTMNPNDRAVVRFSPSGEILAATPSRLIAHITSPSFLDYELLSDFFLTFRAFLSTRDLVAYLIARLTWAVDRQDDFGRIVRVRTFVALRHWILNYFVDDFVPSYPLRTYFCNLVNGLYRDLKARADGGAGDVKIVGELKKCWRRTCVMYWETEDGLNKDFADEELLPGGPVELLVAHEEPETPVIPRQVDRDTKETMGSNPSDQFASRHMEWAQRARHTPQNSLSLPYVPSNEAETVQAPLSPSSDGSMHILSCSLPRRGFMKSEPAMNLPLYPHPVPHSAAPARLATSPQQPASNKKNAHPTHTHKRSGSFSDALRDSRAPLSIPKNASVDITISAVTSMPGSLVRGGLFQPSSPYIELKGTSLRHMRSRSETDGDDMYTEDLQLRPGHANSPGMKKIFGSVRRALSIKQSPHASPQLGAHVQQRMAPSIRSSNPGTITTISGGVRKQRTIRTRPEIRVDALASKVGESFKEAVEEQLRDRNLSYESGAEPPELCGFEFEFENRKTPSTVDDAKASKNSDPRVYSNITTGSKSILIIDDTGPPPLPVISGALPPTASEETNASSTPPKSLQRNPSIAQRLTENDIVVVRHSDLYKDPTPRVSVEERRLSRPLTQQSWPAQRRSMSEGREQMRFSYRQGSMRKSMARSSLRRHASHNSTLSRRQGPESVATFLTMSSNNDPFFLERQASQGPGGPGRMLRRKPGGDLRAAGNIQDLEMTPRPHSTGSISNRTHSIANSVVLRTDYYAAPEHNASQPTEAVDETVVVKKPISLVDTHSSQPNLRPSFEAEVAKLAALPDDTDDEGGVEAALMKLEGRYEKRSPQDSSGRASVQPEVYRPSGAPVPPENLSIPPYNPKQSDEHGGADESLHRPLATPGAEGQDMYHLSGENFSHRVPPIVSTTAGSEDSYSSVPLLDRGLSDVIAVDHMQTLDTMRSLAKPFPVHLPENATEQTMAPITNPMSTNSSLEYVVETDSMRRISNGGTLPSTSIVRQSFLLDEDEDLSDIASMTTGARSDDNSHGVRSFFEDEPAVINHSSTNLPTHPMRHPPTPPSTADRLKEAALAPSWDRGLPTPGLTPTVSRQDQSGQHIHDQNIKMQESYTKQPTSAAHLPFILAYDAELLAQQFTVIEKDALDEIDWKELIELRWKQSSPQIRDWVHYLRTQEARGVDVVIARFNLVVKWAVSECVLTENIEERARCIVKYIHIASHARKLRNYATMYQIAIALISNDVARLHKTWALVPTAEKQTMKELEALVQPLRNFHNLRLEMETATVEDGCIPFIGIYTRDLIYNAQKPAFIDAPPVDGERLVNFERHHTAATIVKNLLRLLEASSKYNFKVDPDLISKCLWLAALSDDEIAQRSRQCE